jgi:transposase
MAEPLLPDETWDEIKPLLPPHPPRPKGGRPFADDRDCLRAILFIARTGMAYNTLPADVFGVSGVTAWRRLRDWTLAGVWPEMHLRALNGLGKFGAIDQDKVVVDSQSVRAVFGGRTPARTP